MSYISKHLESLMTKKDAICDSQTTKGSSTTDLKTYWEKN